MKTNSCPLRGSSCNFCFTSALRPSQDLRRSVGRVWRHSRTRDSGNSTASAGLAQAQAVAQLQLDLPDGFGFAGGADGRQLKPGIGGWGDANDRGLVALHLLQRALPAADGREGYAFP